MPDKFVLNIPKEKALAAGEAAYMPKGMVTIPFNPQLINTGSKQILIDCGNGVANLEPSKGAVGRTLIKCPRPKSIPRRLTWSCFLTCTPITSTAFALPMARWPSRMRKSWRRQRIHNCWMNDENAAKAEIQSNHEKLFCRSEESLRRYRK